MTRKHLTAAGLGLLTVLLCWVGLASFSRRQPAFQGKSLSEWAQQYGSNHWTTVNSAADEQAALAIQQIGTNGIPFLLELMRARDPALKKKLRTSLPRNWHGPLGLGDNSGNIRRIGAHGLAALGTNASAAVPALVELAIHHPDTDGRYTAVFALRTLGSAAEPAIPFLIQCLTNKSNIIRDEAAIGLGSMQRQPQMAVPALIDYLHFARTSPSKFELEDGIQTLARFGTEAKAAVPLLLTLLNDPDPAVRQQVTNCLPRIDPDAAAKAHVTRD